MKKVLPFEFRALEVCLESACRCLEAEVLSKPSNFTVNKLQFDVISITRLIVPINIARPRTSYRPEF
jgi:hypothetical protein